MNGWVPVDGAAAYEGTLVRKSGRAGKRLVRFASMIPAQH